jgi:hypothetical protein
LDKLSVSVSLAAYRQAGVSLSLSESVGGFAWEVSIVNHRLV